jgi:hypothetical protein
MDLQEFRNFIQAQRKEQAKQNTEKILSVVNATITTTKGKEN